MGVGFYKHWHRVDNIAFRIKLMVIILLNIKYITVCLNSLTVAGTTVSNLFRNQTANKSNPIKHIHVFCLEPPQTAFLSDIFT